METIDDPEALTEEWLEKLDEKYHPERVVIEYNGMWKVSDFESLKLPKGWGMRTKDHNSRCEHISDISCKYETIVCGNGPQFRDGII